MIEARASSVISAAETGCVQIMGIRRYTLWVVWRTGWNERGDCRRIFSQPGEKFWADAEYAADCHCHECVPIMGVHSWLFALKKRRLLRKRSDRFVTGHLVFRKKEGGNQ